MKNPVFLFFIIILVHVETIERFGAATARSSLSYKLCSSVLNILRCVVDAYTKQNIQTSVSVYALYYITFILLKKEKNILCTTVSLLYLYVYRCSIVYLYET